VTRERGFTIVELLIVIVVIAILAAISVVAYSGIQQRAKASAAKSDLRNFAKAIEAARGATGKTLLGVTGDGNSSSSQSRMNNSIDDISAASGIDISSLKAGDPWGNYYRMDENEGESSPTDCRQDRIWSASDSSIVIYFSNVSGACL
jgi:prepilin-type N-terminal cleavage/methylation domain-containing protein